MTIISAFHTAGGVQVNRQIDAQTLRSDMVFPGDDEWAEAVAAAGYFEASPEAPPPTPEQLLAEARSKAALSRIDFLLAAKAAGVLSEEDAIAAARGEVPPSMAGLIAAMQPSDRFEAEVRWAAATRIERMDPFITGWAAALGITDTQIDALFGL